MRLFRVTGEWKTRIESAERFATITNGETGPGIYLPSCALPVCGELAEPFKGNKVESLQLPIARLEEGEGLYPAPKALIDRMNKYLHTGDHHARYYGRCLVHLDLPDNGYPHTLHAASFSERLIETRHGRQVAREYFGIGDAEGIEIIADEGNGRQALLCMAPHAAFRVHRPNNIEAIKQSPSLMVSWTGCYLHVTRPAYARHPEAKERRDTQPCAPRAESGRQRRYTPPTLGDKLRLVQ